MDTQNLEVHTWFERDRACVELRDSDTEQTIVEFWDDAVGDAIQDGYLNPRDWRGSLIEYAKEFGLI